MGEEVLKRTRIKLLSPYQVNGGLMAKSEKTMLPFCIVFLQKGEEVTVDVIEGVQEYGTGRNSETIR